MIQNKKGLFISSDGNGLTAFQFQVAECRTQAGSLIVINMFQQNRNLSRNMLQVSEGTGTTLFLAVSNLCSIKKLKNKIHEGKRLTSNIYIEFKFNLI